MSKMRFFALQELANRRPVKVDYPSEKLSDYYGDHVFDRKKMQEYLPSEAYKAVINAIEKGTPINREMADMIANGMKNWAKTFNVTHYTHWFQPLTDGTAEKHDGFIEFGDDGDVIERFSGKLLIQQEPDASSFPNGGIRNTFEARGYTAWDVSSPAFIVDSTLCIPTIFISYTGEALDYKTPLLKALGAVDKAATEVCKMFDPNVKRVYANLGWEQEYFLVDTVLYNARPDLCLTGRTLMGHSSAKDQQLDDHYFGSIPSRVTNFMKELELECHRLGIPAKTRHNEVAPNQFELAPIFEDVNLANDHNQLVMDLMKRIAAKHNFTVLLHEKPFKGVNGSGKHNNWSLCTDTGINLFSPAKTAEGNMLFLTFIVNVLMMVYKNQDLLRASIVSAGNSHRLGANEAPPAIVSIFLGDELTHVLESIETDTYFGKQEKIQLDTGAPVLPHFLKDNTDRNRTSPFAFTGNKFEFRMLGSAASVATPNIILNTAVAESLDQFYEELKDTDPADMDEAVHALLKRAIQKHKKVIFNGNGYSDEWVKEASRRGLDNLESTPDCLERLLTAKSITLFTKHHIYTEEEIRSRHDILLENYVKTIAIEARTMVDILSRDFLPALLSYTGAVASSTSSKKALLPDLKTDAEEALVRKLSNCYEILADGVQDLKEQLAKTEKEEDLKRSAFLGRNLLIPSLEHLGTAASEAEALIPEDLLPYPSYDQLLFSL